MKRDHITILLVALGLTALGGSPGPQRVQPEFLGAPTPWADSMLATLDLDERIAQLMMVAAYSNKDAAHEKAIEALVKERNIGGLIFFQGGPGRQAGLTNRYQAAARTPLMVGMDLEWGLAMRLDSSMRFPKQMTLGAVQDERLISEMGREIARQMRRLGVQVSFSPVADVNNNPANPVINDRSFGEDRENVARKAIAYMRGLQEGGVIATAKHFPGHGDTDTDSHHALPLIAHSRTRLDSLELYPFQRLVDEGITAMMVAHLEVPALDTTVGLPSTLSRPIVNDLLEDQLGFRGLVFTDALNMKGIANAEKPGEIELRALLAGNDVMLFPQDPIAAIERIKRAVEAGEVPREMIDHKCLKVLRAKEWAGLGHWTPIPTKDLIRDLNTMQGRALRRKLYAAGITVLRDKESLLPLRQLDSLRIASVVIGDTVDNAFQRELGRYSAMRRLSISKTPTPKEVQKLLLDLEPYDLVITSVHHTSYRVSRDFGIPDRTLDLLNRLAQEKDIVHVHFANPYRLTHAYGLQRARAVVVAYEEEPDAQDMVAQAIFGAVGANGRLPVTASGYFRMGDGRDMAPIDRFSFGLPEETGVSSADLNAVRAIVREGIEAKAYPGCQVLVAVQGKVIMNEAFGHATYEKTHVVGTEDVYDLASLTKVAATTLSLMRLVDEGRIDIDADLGTYLQELNGEHETHARMKLRDVLTHQAGLQAWSAFYLRLMKDGRVKEGVLSPKEDDEHTVRVAEGVYMRQAYRDSIIPWVLATRLGKKGEYVYSDMGYYLIQQIIERITGKPLDHYVMETFYRPMGMATMGYLPYWRIPMDRIMPTEYDVEFRRTQLHGDVHDPGAAMMGGVGGHAGLFSNAVDMGMLMQLLLNKGVYGGRRYLSEAVVTEFTKCQFCAPNGKGNRRGLGFDKPIREGEGGPTCQCVSYASYGHTGFTGTMAWVDPEQQVVYVFLSNRVHPSAGNKKLLSMNIRTRIQEVVHDAVAARVTTAAK